MELESFDSSKQVLAKVFPYSRQFHRVGQIEAKALVNVPG